MVSERIWRNTAIALCIAVPASFYILGDLADAFPGVLTTASAQQEPTAGPRAVAEDWERDQAAVPTGQTATSTSSELAADLQERMDAQASLAVVDGNLAYAVVDAETGAVIAERDSDTARTPASTLKLLTAAAVLRLYGADETIATRAVVADQTVTLVGEGDMTLTEDDLRDLAEQTAALVAQQGGGTVSLVLDTSLITGGQNAAWGSNGTAGGWVAPTSALAIDEGWLDGQEYGQKSFDPAGDAADRFAELLAEAGVDVQGEIASGTAPEGAAEAVVQSAPIGDIVRRTLQISDNTAAEMLAHLVALRRGEPTTPEGAAAAVRAEIVELGQELGVPQEDLDALVINDGSGLSRDDRVPPALLAAVLAEVASGDVPQLEQILYDVPIAGLSGTLAERFGADGTASARGLVRGKTGYLGGTASLAGVAVLADGRTVGYSILVHGFDGADAAAARAAVDEVAAQIVEVG
ncbi:D-alanyl-D-alanine carboxypeptidase/D-alanyl-D-alanine endopeptidase [Brachybacterium sp. DNPG3]